MYYIQETKNILPKVIWPENWRTIGNFLELLGFLRMPLVSILPISGQKYGNFGDVNTFHRLFTRGKKTTFLISQDTFLLYRASGTHGLTPEGLPKVKELFWFSLISWTHDSNNEIEECIRRSNSNQQKVL